MRRRSSCFRVTSHPSSHINDRTWAEVIAHGGCACERHLQLRTSKLSSEWSSVLKEYPEDDTGNDTLNRTGRIRALLEDQPHRERAPERSSIAELAGKKSGAKRTANEHCTRGERPTKKISREAISSDKVKTKHGSR